MMPIVKKAVKAGAKAGKKVLATDAGQKVVGTVVDSLEKVVVEKADDVAEEVKTRAARAGGRSTRKTTGRKKTTARKKTTSRKKTGTRKPASRKKTSTRKPATRKKTTARKSSARKPSSRKKTTSRKR
jgi:microcompartment protein CcmL/EutN